MGRLLVITIAVLIVTAAAALAADALPCQLPNGAAGKLFVDGDDFTVAVPKGAAFPEGWTHDQAVLFCIGYSAGHADGMERVLVVAAEIAQDRDHYRGMIDHERAQCAAQIQAAARNDRARELAAKRETERQLKWAREEAERQRRHEENLAIIDHNARVRAARETRAPVVVVPGYRQQQRPYNPLGGGLN